ncbi:MAG: 2-oxoacid:acceptor oxidoreductase family protein [Planctomycetes bacterium]|nr:2-oxoacid:acceptor oxidoreductase family protein [Planctomycetota bacterium]
MSATAAKSGVATIRILMVGVGGQGVLTAGRVIGEAALAANLDVRVGQLHGMSQRGGSVETTVVIGAGESAFVGAGTCDLLLALEPLEALRAAPRLRPGATVWLSTARIVPGTVGAVDKPYPSLSEIEALLTARGAQVHTVNATDLAASAGDAKAVSAFMLGMLIGAGSLPIDEELFDKTVSAFSPARSRETTLRAYRLGVALQRKESGGGLGTA